MIYSHTFHSFHPSLSRSFAILMVNVYLPDLKSPDEIVDALVRGASRNRKDIIMVV